jgi:tRNA(fMet)-specific endonuclease VapC
MRFRGVSDAEIALCDVVKAELYYGAEKSVRVEENLARLEGFFARFASLPFEGQAARAYDRIRADLEAKGTTIGPNDLMIAAIAVAAGLTLVTNNVQEFARVEGLTVEDWTAEPAAGK